MARKMVCEWGMSDKLGPLTFGKNEEHIFLGREVARQKDYSEDTALAIDSEVKRIVIECAHASPADSRGQHREAPRAGARPPRARVARRRRGRPDPPNRRALRRSCSVTASIGGGLERSPRQHEAPFDAEFCPECGAKLALVRPSVARGCGILQEKRALDFLIQQRSYNGGR